MGKGVARAPGGLLAATDPKWTAEPNRLPQLRFAFRQNSVALVMLQVRGWQFGERLLANCLANVNRLLLCCRAMERHAVAGDWVYSHTDEWFTGELIAESCTDSLQ